MVKIKPGDLEVTKELFLEVHDAYRRADKEMTIEDAYYAAVSYFQEEGYKIKYTTFESFRKNAYYNQKRK
jgi:hypothetical protein